MPKETVTPKVGPYEAQVGWRPLSPQVQVGVETVDGHYLLDMLYGGIPILDRIGRAVTEVFGLSIPDQQSFEEIHDEYARRGRQILDIVSSAGFDVEGHYTGLWTTLDRQGANDLIRHIRKARDAAFGKDQ